MRWGLWKWVSGGGGGGAQNLSRLGKVSRNSSPSDACQYVRGLLVSARLIHCVASSPSHSTSLVHPFIRPVWMTHARVVCHNPPRPHIVSLSHYLALRALTLSRSISFSYWVTFAFAPVATWYLPLSTSHIVSRYSPYIWSCVARQDNLILSHAQFDAPFNAQVTPAVAAPAVAAHTLLHQPQLRYWCRTIQHTTHHINHCYTNTAPYSTPLGHQPLLHQLLLHRPLLHRPLLHYPLLHYPCCTIHCALQQVNTFGC